MSARPRSVLLTGASAGIGRAAAELFASRGDIVIGVARDRQRLESLAARLGERFSAVVGDVSDPASMDRMVQAVRRLHGVPDVVVANAGIGLDALFVETTDDALRAVLETNVFGVYRTVRPFLPDMIERGAGRIVLVSSIVGKRGIPHYSAYSASKFAIAGVADALHSELWGTGVSVGVVCPSSTESEFQERAGRAGPAQGRFRPQRSSAESVARVIVRMAGSRRREAVLTLGGKLLVAADVAFPRLVDWLLARTLTRRR